MCVDVEIDIEDEFINMLSVLAKEQLKLIVNDECSMTIFTEAKPLTHDELSFAIGKTVLNSVLVDCVKAGIEAAKLNETDN